MKRQQEVIQSLFIFVDSLSVGSAWLLAYLLRFSGRMIPVYYGIPPFSLYATLLFLVIPLWLAFFKFNQLYSLKRGESFIDEVIHVFQSGTLATLFLAALTFFYREYTFSRAVFVLFWILSLTLCTVSRAGLRKVVKALRRKGINIRRTLVVGTGTLAQLVAEKISLYPAFGLRLEGFIDAGNGGEKNESIVPRILGRVGDLLPLIADRKIDQIIISLPRDAHQKMEEVLKILEHEMVDVKVVPDLLQFAVVRAGLEDLDGVPIINLSETPLSGWYGPVKRLADIAISLLFILVTAPLMLVLAALVKLTSPGPVLYKQKRMGLDGSIFTMYKFRSMRTDAEEETGAVWASENDPRRTRFGALMRRTSLDELPQLFNILKGEMSFVGPRPERPEFVERFRGQIPRYMLRHKVKCGLTGWAQVNGYRGNTSLEKRLECDIFYIENWSMSFDVKIIWLTIWKGLVNRHAY